MPHVDSETHDFANSKCFAVLDFVLGYWQIAVHPDSYDVCGIVTPTGTYSSTRLLPGFTNATSHFQSAITPLFEKLKHNMKAWLDDYNIFADSEDKLLSCLQMFFEICAMHGLFLSARKCNFFTLEVKWCGRLISAEGFKLDPARLEGLKDISKPTTAGELCEFFHCCRWMSTTVPAYAERVSPLNDLLELAYEKAGRRTKRAIRHISLRSLSWSAVHDRAFNNLQDTLRDAVRLSYPCLGKSLCIFTDASDKFWSGVVTQVHPDTLSKPFVEQNHEPMAFLGSAFRGSELGWSTFEKEVFAIFQVFEKMDYLFFSGQPIQVFTDHRNLLFVFTPLALEPALGRHIVSKVQRWALFLSRFTYVIEHINGTDNLFAEILTRWTKGYRSERQGLRTLKELYLESTQVVPGLAEDVFLWPDMIMIRNAQQGTETPEGVLVASDGLLRLESKLWVPHQATELKVRLLVGSHCGIMGHRGCDATASILRESFVRESLEADVSEFIAACLHCIVTRAGDKVQRPLATALHGSRPNEVVHMDYLYMGGSISGEQYLLLLRDDLSSYVWLWLSNSATSEFAARAVARWISCFGTMSWLVSDQGTHFKNQLMHNLEREFRIRRHFTRAYSPSSNKSVERVCQEVLRGCRALLSEWCLAPRDWPAVVECVQSVLNHSPLKRLGLRSKADPGVYRTLLEVFTGMRPTRPLLRALPMERYPEADSLDELQAKQLIEIERIQNVLEEVHKEVSERVDAARARQMIRHNEKCEVLPLNFEVGSFVLVREAQQKGHKLRFRWQGPQRIVRVLSRLVFEVESLVSGKRERVHARRLLLYRADLDGKDVSEAMLRIADHSEANYQDVSKLCAIRETDIGIEVQVEWYGLPDNVDCTWEPVLQVHEDVPEMLDDFLHAAGQTQLKTKARILCSPT